MLPEAAQGALSALALALQQDPLLGRSLSRRWGRHGLADDTDAPAQALSADVSGAADRLAALLPALTAAADSAALLGGLFEQPEGEVLLVWCRASTWRRDVQLAPLLARAMASGAAERATAIAHDRVVQGPLHDALACAPWLGDGEALASPKHAEARARLEILIWEAGASAVEVLDLARWVWGTSSTFDAMIRAPAHGALRGRVLAARCLEVSARGLPPATDPELVGQTLRVLQPLLLHPEPLVWVHAARALGRLTGALDQLEGMILDWALGESPLLRQRAMTAFASLPAERLKFLARQLLSILGSPDEQPWVLAAIAAGTPYLFVERRDIWDRLAARILAGDGGAIAARALARGLAALWRRGTLADQVVGPLRALRETARFARTPSLDEARRWNEVIAVTDAVDGAERDPLDLELGLENLVRVAAQYDDEEADGRAARFATSLGATFKEARRIALEPGRVRPRAAAFNALEGCARSFALRLWGPVLATHPAAAPVEEPNLDETWTLIARAPAEILNLVRERRQDDPALEDPDDRALEVLAVRLGGYALDACGEDSALGRGRGQTAHDTCLWLRKLSGLSDTSRELPPELRAGLSALLWRLVDTTRGTALGEVDDVQWLGPFAAWWALVIDRPAILSQLAAALPMMTEGALAACCEGAEALGAAVSSGEPDGSWGPEAETALKTLHADDTELARALGGMAGVLGRFAAAAGPKPNLEDLCLDLVLAGDRLHTALADPVSALHQTPPSPEGESQLRRATENASRIAALLARAIRARELAMLDVWLASLGPVASALIEGAVRAAIRRTPPPPPRPKKPQAKVFEGYELVKPLGEGGIGTVWLVRKPGADRFFVLKAPKVEALANATETERAGILASFVEEANALAGIYHPNVANIIDRGVSAGTPFLVLEYLIGADLKHYASARLMSLFELRQVVLETCAGLSALHSAGLVHRDIKPANLWLRLPLAGGEIFDPGKHRDPARAQPLATVVIDFGMVRAVRVPAEAGGRFVAGTAGYIAPEQVLDPVELDVRADVYALAATIYNVTTGRAFFDEIENARDRILAHMRTDPFEDADRLRPFPASIAKLLRAATAHDPRDRPAPMEFGREFAGAL